MVIVGQPPSNIVNYNWTAFLKFQKINLPRKGVQDKFNFSVKPLHKQVYQLGKQNQLLKEARDILLPRLMTGMIDVESLSLPKSESLIEKLQAGEDSTIASEFNVDDFVNDLHNKYA